MLSRFTGRRFRPGPWCFILADGGNSFQRHVTACDRPFIVLLQHQCADEAADGWFVGENTDDIRAALDLLVQPFQRIGGVDLPPVGLRESLVGQHVSFGAQHQLGELGMAWLEGFDQLGPVFLGLCQSVLIKGRPEGRRDNRAVFLADTGQRVAHEVHAAALEDRLQHAKTTYVTWLLGSDRLWQPATNPTACFA